MNLKEAIKNRILKFLKLEHLSANPNSNRLTFINDDDAIKSFKVREAKTWYYGDSSELDNFYREENINGIPSNPIYTQNIRRYFRALGIKECEVKKVHSGVPHAIVDTLVNVIGTPLIQSKDEIVDSRLEKIIKESDFINILNQRQLPMTLVEGWGAYKINFDKQVSDVPIIQYYSAENVDFITKFGKVIGIVYRDYYKKDGKDYVLLETRRIANGNSYIEYELFRLGKSNDLEKVPLGILEELATLPENGYEIQGLNKILGVPCRIFYDDLNPDYGRSIFMGKIDLFDDLDQILSQESQTVRVSTPVEYYNEQMLKRGPNGETLPPKLFNRQYVKAPTGPMTGDGMSKDKQIVTTQPQLNFNQYSEEARAKLDFILTGLLSPATMGIEVAKKDNAEAQREKEKVTIMTRNNVIDREQEIIPELLSLALMVEEYMRTGNISIQDYDISVKFDEFATPSLEEKLSTWGTAYQQGIASEEQIIDSIYGDSLSDEERAREIAYIKENKQADNLDMSMFDMNNGNTEADRPIISE